MDEASLKTRMQSVVDTVILDIASIRTGRATSALVESLEIAVYGGSQKLKIQELATISSPDPQTLVLDPWDKSVIGEIRQGILAANVGMNPSIDGEIIRISFPPLTTEDREKYTKLLAAKLENGRIMLRQIRGDAMHETKKQFEAKEISEDEKFASEKRIQEITDEFMKKIEEAGERKKTGIT